MYTTGVGACWKYWMPSSSQILPVSTTDRPPVQKVQTNCNDEGGKGSHILSIKTDLDSKTISDIEAVNGGVVLGERRLTEGQYWGRRLRCWRNCKLAGNTLIKENKLCN